MVEPSFSNQGWLNPTVDESVGLTAGRFVSKESVENPPKLTVNFSAPTNSLRIDFASIEGTDFCLRFQARAGKTYVVERRAQIETGVWTLVKTLPPAVADGPVTVLRSVGSRTLVLSVGEREQSPLPPMAIVSISPPNGPRAGNIRHWTVRHCRRQRLDQCPNSRFNLSASLHHVGFAGARLEAQAKNRSLRYSRNRCVVNWSARKNSRQLRRVFDTLFRHKRPAVNPTDSSTVLISQP